MSRSCGRCERAFDAATWESLRVVDRMRREALRDIVSEWPWSNDAFLEVRVCTCGATVTRLVDSGRAPLHRVT